MDIVQKKNPRTKRYIKIDREKGRILSHKKSNGAYKGITIVGKSLGISEQLLNKNNHK
jgi:hypothetical protein